MLIPPKPRRKKSSKDTEYWWEEHLYYQRKFFMSGTAILILYSKETNKAVGFSTNITELNEKANRYLDNLFEKTVLSETNDK